MLRTLIVGLGRAGHGLHYPVMSRLRDSMRPDGLVTGQPFVGYDPRGIPDGAAPGDLVLASSLAHARDLLDPASTVVHLCTPPLVRAGILEELAQAGFRKIIVEKPLAVGRGGLKLIGALRSKYGLTPLVMAHWLDSALTRRLADIVASGELGELRSVSMIQRKPRFNRSLAADAGHPTAFDIELPHSVGVALRLGGDAKVIDTACTDMLVAGTSIPRMGTVRLVLQHDDGANTEIFSSLVSPSRERRISLLFERGSVVGYYPESQHDNFAHLRVRVGTRDSQDIFPDDSLATFFLGAYQRFVAGEPSAADFELNVRIVRLLSDAKDLVGADSADDVAG